MKQAGDTMKQMMMMAGLAVASVAAA